MSDAKYAALRGISTGDGERRRPVPTTSTDEWHLTPADARSRRLRRPDGGCTGEQQPIELPAPEQRIDEKKYDGLPVYRGAPLPTKASVAGKRPLSLRKRILLAALSTAALLNTFFCLSQFNVNYLAQRGPPKNHKTNVILMISDG